MEQKKIAVIKYGGHAMDVENLRSEFMGALKKLYNDFALVIVHGGAPHINKLLEKLNVKSTFHEGLRITDAAVMEAVEMVLCGSVNKEIVRHISECGLSAVGISGQDSSLFQAEIIKPELGHVGKVIKVNPEIVICLLNGGFIPVIAPVAIGPAGIPLNVNADTAAGALAGALGADYFIMISDVPGVLDPEGQLFSFLSADAIQELKEKKVIRDGMIPKVDACLNACTQGCKRAIILNGGKRSSLENYLLNFEVNGTEIGM